MWYKILQIVEWFGDRWDRYQVVKDFNKSAEHSFISQKAPTLLKANIVKGDSAYKHSFSNFFGSGFKIKALSGKPLSRSELIEIGKIILDNTELVRKLIALGFDTFYVHDNAGINGCKWALEEYGKLGGYIK